MELKKITDRICYYPFETERDRPVLGYIRGDRLSMAVDAGHSMEHVDEFYNALDEAHLPRPSLTAITHWHWDHTLGMHHINGLSIAGKRTNAYLKGIISGLGDKASDYFLELDETIRAEYATGQPLVVTSADIEFEGKMEIDLGGLHVQLFSAESPHTDDSVLIYVPEEKCLFLGDSICGVYPTWEVDNVMMERLIMTVERIDFEYALAGHWDVMTREELIREMRESMTGNNG